jgi:putative ABC transport system substrate-binding protein
MVDVRRREFITLLGGAAAAWPVAARAQQIGQVARVVLWLGGLGPSDPETQRVAAAFRESMRGLGWVDGRNLRIDLRWIGAAFSAQEMSAAATETISLSPDVVVTTGAPILAALQSETKTIPLVFTFVTDPVSDGFVASLARPGGNITGFTIFEHSFAGKWLEMLKEVVPGMTRVAVMQNPDHPAWTAYLRALGTIAPRIGVEVRPTPVSSVVDIAPALDAFARVPNGGLIILPSAVGTQHREAIASAALRHRLPSIYSLRMYPQAGGLMSYGVTRSEPYSQAATYVDRILKGAKPAELPVQAAAKFEMVFNLKTATSPWADDTRILPDTRRRGD